MAKRLHHLLVLLLIISFLQKCAFSDQSQGFSLNLVRRELTDDIFPESIRPPITRSLYLFTIDASIGTPPRKRTFIFDTASALTWTQCTPCVHCFKQDYPLFDPKTSTSYQKLPPNHALSRFFDRPNKNGECIFNVTYMSGESSSGIASVDTFTFPSNKRSPESIKGVVFGCSNNHQGKLTSNTLVTGIMGMNRSPLSLIGQMGTKSVKRFSYCLPKVSSPVKSTFLRFGNDIKKNGKFKKTGFLSAGGDYSVRLVNISINGRQLSLPKGSLSKGCVLDVGSGASSIETRAYNVVLSVLGQYFGRFNLTRISGIPSPQGDLCYRVQRGFRSYPSMILHFQGADFEIGPENLFRIVDDRFCLALFGTQDVTILGAYQQQNVRFVYDVGSEKLLFAKEDCSLDRA